MTLSDEELERYARHLVLRQVGGTGQAAIRRARVLMVGAGGLGSPCALYLAAAGIGTIGLVDDDTVSLSNLQRQLLFRTRDVGRLKVEVGREALNDLNPGVTIEPHAVRITAANIADLIAGYDIIADGSDNFATRFLLNDACTLAGKPLVSAAVTEFEGQLSVYQGRPCYRCLFPAPPPPGAAAGVMGSLQALEVLKLAGGFGQPLSGKILTYKALTGEFRTATLPPDPGCPLCGSDPQIQDLSAHS
jgi:molybdopterin/thiamine biosynthesis adenylyltransferase